MTCNQSPLAISLWWSLTLVKDVSEGIYQGGLICNVNSLISQGRGHGLSTEEAKKRVKGDVSSVYQGRGLDLFV